VVRVFTTGRAFGRFFIAMEFVTGGHFEHQITERGTIPEKEMLPLAIQVAEGLKAAHAAGLIHRDIKPGNILLDRSGNAKIVDFGLALLLGKGGTVQAQEIWATPYYVPPETIEGHAEDVGSDMYAFGATLYHAMAGIPPCNEESMATDVLREAKKKVVPLQKSAPWLTPLTCAVIDRAMAYDPAKRYQSYDAMIAQLNDALKHLLAGTSPPQADPAATVGAESGRRRGERLLTVVGAMTLMVGLAGAAWWALRKPPEPNAKPAPPQVDGSTPAVKMTAPQSDLATAARIVQLHRDARRALELGNYEQACGLLGALRDDAAGQEPTRTWAGVEAVVMSYLDGNSAKARKAAQAIVAHIAAAQLDDPSIKQLLLPVLAQLDTLPPTVVDANRLTPVSSAQAMAWLLAALKNWEQGHLSDAVGLFTAVSTAELAPQDLWSAYQKLARDYLADFKLLSDPVFVNVPKGKNACQQAIDALTAIQPQLKTRGRATFNVNAWRLDLARLARQEEAPPPPPPPPPNGNAPPVASGPPALADVMEALAKHAGACKFADATAYLQSLPVDPPGALRKSLLELTHLADRFIREVSNELKNSEVNLEGRLKSGEVFTKIATAADGQVVVTLQPGRVRECGWGDLAPASIIDIYRVIIKNETNESVRLRGHECAIAFEWLTISRTRAAARAEQLAQSSAVFKDRWKDIEKGLPK
jgi:hypothetical protein